MRKVVKSKKFYRINSFIPVRNLKETLDFYRDRLGFYDEWTWNDLDGGIQRDDMRLLFSAEPVYKDTFNTDYLPIQLWFVDNVDLVYTEYRNSGIEIIREIENKPWGTREFIFSDLNGHLIRVAEAYGMNRW